jgi:acetyltransferase
LDLPGPFEVEKAANRMLERIAIACPQARIDGFSVQRMADRRYAHEVIIGMTTDPIFGPAIMFGEGGTAVELISDFALGLPPLNTNLARTLIERTRIARLLHGFGSHPPADIEALDRALVMVSQLVVDIPEIVELDINPLFADASGVMAVDCRIAVARVKGSGRDRLAIRPYPKEQEEVATLKDGTRVLLRPIRPEDEPNHHTLIARLSAEDFRYRFFGTTGAIPHSEMARLTQIDYDREMAFVAIPEGSDETWGVVRAITDPDDERAEFAVLVRSDLSGCGLGRTLMDKIIRYCKGRGNTSITGQVLNDNPRMLSFVESLGFVRGRRNDDGIIEVTLDLTAPTSVR